MPVFTDQLGRTIDVVSFPPKRIISLVPSQTELLYYLGLGDKIAGQTVFCVHPEDRFKEAVKIGGTKKLKLDKIRELNPDLIIGNKEENEQSQIEILQNEFPVWMSDIVTFEQSLEMITGIGEITGTDDRAIALKQEIERAFEAMKAKVSSSGVSVLYLIWKDPYMAAGTGTYIHRMLEVCGLHNVLSQSNIPGKNFSRYPELSDADIQQLSPGLILLSSEPYPFRDKHIEALKKLVPDAQILLADGEMFSWYGYRMLYLPDYYQNVLKPHLI